MRTALATLIAVCLLLGGCATSPGLGFDVAEANEPGAIAEGPEPIVPDAELQSLIDQLVRSGSLDEMGYGRVITRLRANARPAGGANDSEDHVIRQAALYAAHARRITQEEHINDVPDGRMAVIYVRKVLEIPESRIVSVLAPYLRSKDGRLQEFVCESVLEVGTTYNECDLSDPIVPGLAEFVSRDMDAPPLDAAQILYWRAPSAAVLEFVERSLQDQPAKRQEIRDAVAAVVRVTGEPESLAGGRIKVDDPLVPGGILSIKPQDRSRKARAEAIESLRDLSHFDEWWVKLYVAEMVRRYYRKPDLRDAKIVERLRKDANPVVAKAADVPFHHGTRAERLWWLPFPVKDDPSDLKYLWRPDRKNARK